jgi:hypothetical protein
MEISLANFKLLESTRYLDFNRLEKRAKARIEIGTIKTDCCNQTVCAIVKKGMVTSIEIMPFDEVKTKRADLGLDTLKLRKAVRRAIGIPRAATRKLPVALSDLINRPGIIFETWFCIRICIFGHCVTICFGDDWIVFS